MTQINNEESKEQKGKYVYSFAEATAYLNIGKNTLLDAIKLGQIGYSRPRRDYRFCKEDMDKWLERGKVEALNPTTA